MKIEYTWKGGGKVLEQWTLYEKDIKGKRVWFEITCKKEERALIDVEETLDALMELGAAPGSRVTVTGIPTETVRAAEITAVNTPVKKFEIWAENSNVEYEETLLKKIEAIESEITVGAIRASGEWELASLRLRGAIGIKKGIRKDEIFLDFDAYADGLIALTGANGRGKTTLIENCHPYPQLLTRKGKLQDHFFLRDSFREVIYRNRADGSLRKFLVQIDGQNKSGSCKYFIFTQTQGLAGMEWEPLPGVDGNLKPYEEALNGIFGPMELYLRTAFITQRPARNLPDLTDATAGEKKALFVELAGIDYLQRFADAAVERAKREAAKIHDAEIRAEMLKQAVGGKDRETVNLEFAGEALEKARGELAEVTGQGKAAKADADRLREAFNTEKARQEKENEARKAVERVQEEICALDADKARYQEFAKNKSGYEKEIAGYEALQKTVDAENAKKQKVLEANSAKQREYTEILAAHHEKVKAVETERDKLRDRMSGLDRLLSDARNNIKLYERDAAEIKENCPTCGQRLPPDKIAELNARREQFVAKIKKEQAEAEKHKNQLEGLNEQIEALKDQIADLSFDEPAPVKLEQFNESALRIATGKMGLINIEQSRAALAKAREAAVRIEGLEQQIADKFKVLEEKRKEVFTLMADTRSGGISQVSKEFEAAVSRHAELTERYTAVKAEIARQEAVIEAARRVIAEIEAQEKELEALKQQMADSLREGGAWELIAKAFGKDGIQALELDALAPGISDTANRILESAYGDRFKIAIETTRMGGAGKKAKQIEDFVIKVIDSEDGEAVNLDDKSGGEAVWIKRAIYDAFAVIRKRNTNFAFLSCFQDEADGALDSAAKTAYISMLAASHQESKLRHTIIITHSQEALAAIEQKIRMEEFV
jgi:exonuclease SbcC